MYVCKPSLLRRNGCCYRVLCCVSCLSISLTVLLTFYMMVKSKLHVLDDSLMQLDKCPACFGIWESTCQGISSGALKIQANYFWKSESVKGVWYGVWNDNLPVVVKRLGHSDELEILDQEICLNTTEPVGKYCNVHDVVWRTFLNPALPFKSAIMQFMECSSELFASLVESKLKSRNVVQLDQKIMAITNLHFNQEFIFLQVFSKRYSNFLPALYGACGRVIVVEHVGPSLSSVLGRSWQDRVKLSINLIQLARKFTRTEDNMALYMYDVVMDNFAVDKHDNVKLIDCEHVLIVDMSPFNRTYVTKTEDFCAANHFQCLTFVPQDLCQGQAQDHNYYAICRNILAAVGGTRGLLHSPPDDAVDSTLKYLLYNCVYSRKISREQTIDKLEKVLYKYIKYNKRDENG